MASQPVLRKLERYVEQQGGDAWIMDQLAAGLSVGQVAAGITLPGHGSISRPLLYNWRNKSEARREGWALAMKLRGHALAEEAGEVLDSLVGTAPSAAEVSLAKSRAEYRRWLAGRLNAEAYGEDKQALLNVNLNVGDLHLDALRRVGHMSADRREERTALAHEGRLLNG
jgi:hypothetical protein